MKLAKLGFYGGNPENVLKARVDLVLNCMHYIKFENKIELAYHYLNKKDTK